MIFALRRIRFQLGGKGRGGEGSQLNDPRDFAARVVIDKTMTHSRGKEGEREEYRTYVWWLLLALFLFQFLLQLAS